MTGKFTVSGANTTVAFEYTALTAKIQSVIGDCAHSLWDRGQGNHGTEEAPILFASLTNAQKLALVDAQLKKVILAIANDYKSKVATDLARETEASNKYILP